MRIEVNGIPAPQGSKRHVGNGRMVESSRAVGPWREAVRAETQRVWEAGKCEFEPDVAVEVNMSFVLPRPKTAKKRVWPSVRPDLDKLIRSTLDGLVMGGAFADDALVVAVQASKEYDDVSRPGCTIFVMEAS